MACCDPELADLKVVVFEVISYDELALFEIGVL